MSIIDQIFTDEDNEVLWLRIIGICVALVLILPLMFHRPGTRRKRLYRRYIMKSGRFYNRHCAQQIATFLGEVSQACLVSGRNLTVVEVGCGPFPSLKAYPRGTKLICIEPCNEFNKHIEKEWRRSHLASKRESEQEMKEEQNEQENRSRSNLSTSSSSSSVSGAEDAPLSDADIPRVEDERESQLLIYNVAAERMVEVVGSKSVDVVVARQLLCSIDDVPTVLSQISEVLKPGGQYFFWEHVRSDSRFVRFFQALLAYPPFSYLTGCDLRRKNPFAENAPPGFSRVEVQSFSAPLPWYMFPYSKTISGCAVK